MLSRRFTHIAQYSIPWRPTSAASISVLLAGLAATNDVAVNAAEQHAGYSAMPTAIAEVNALAEIVISCPDGSSGCSDPRCMVSNPSRYTVVGQLQSAPGLFASSFDSQGFSVSDGTGGIFILNDEESRLRRGDWVQVVGTTSCQFGTLALGDTLVNEKPSGGPVVFSPRQIGQLAKRPAIPGSPAVTPNWCNCLMPFSATEGQVLTVRGTAVADLEDDGSFGYKLFVDDGTGVAQIFIDADSDVSVDKSRQDLLVQGADLCVSGVVGHFAGVGYELLPRNDKDIRLARPEHKNPCKPL